MSKNKKIIIIFIVAIIVSFAMFISLMAFMKTWRGNVMAEKGIRDCFIEIPLKCGYFKRNKTEIREFIIKYEFSSEEVKSKIAKSRSYLEKRLSETKEKEKKQALSKRVDEHNAFYNKVLEVVEEMKKNGEL